MPEFAKTLIFVGAAALLGVLALVFRPASLAPPELKLDDKLFADIDDATAVDALEIVRYDKNAGGRQRLKVARGDGGWVIASHNDYPADANDAKDRIQDAALTLMDLKIVGLASELSSDHALLGVVSPEGNLASQTDSEDIGTLVTLEDEAGRKLAKLIIGKPYPKFEGQRFVCKDGEKRVYTAKIDIDEFSSKFEDWIDTDLLGIHPPSIRQVTLKDYSAEIVPVQRGNVIQLIPRRNSRSEMTLDWDQKQQLWKMQDFAEFRDNQRLPAKLAESEQLNKEKLDSLKSAIGQLKIIDAQAKPEELLAEIKSDEDLLANERLSGLLMRRGFYPSRGELLGANGEVRVQTDDGVEYILRFGNESGIESGEEEAKLNRYLLVSARVAENQLQPEPPSTIPPAGEEEGEPLSGAGGQAGEPGEAAEPTGDEAPVETGEDDQPDTPAPSTADDAEPADAPPADEPDTGPPDATPPPEQPAVDDALVAKRLAAEAKVAEVNKKFSKWFYIVSEDVYKDLRLSRFDVIQQKDEDSFGLDELNNLDNPLPPRSGGFQPPE